MKENVPKTGASSQKQPLRTILSSSKFTKWFNGKASNEPESAESTTTLHISDRVSHSYVNEKLVSKSRAYHRMVRTSQQAYNQRRSPKSNHKFRRRQQSHLLVLVPENGTVSELRVHFNTGPGSQHFQRLNSSNWTPSHT
jgi:hypothetical protein